METPLDRAREYDAFIASAKIAPFVPDLLERADIQPGEQVLDLACGSGLVARALAARSIPGVRIVGADLSPLMLQVAQEYVDRDHLEVELQVADALNLPFTDGEFDVVTCQQGIQFFPDKLAGMRETFRVLKPGGRALVSVWQGAQSNEVYVRFWQLIGRYTGRELTNTPFNWGDPEKLQQTLETAGFAPVSLAAVTRELESPDAHTWVEKQFLGASAAVPEMSKVDQSERERIVREIEQDMSDQLQQFRKGDRFVIPGTSTVAIAFKPVS